MPNDVYLSSTLIDLQAERKAARDVLGGHGFGVKDSYQASEDALVPSCLDDVGQCAIYVCIVGKRYGHVPPATLEHPNPDAKSITQMELDEARRRKLPCFVFMKSETRGYDDIGLLDTTTGENERGARIQAFRGWLAQQVRPTMFESIGELREKLLAAVLQYQNHKAGAPSSILVDDARHRAELTADVGLVLHPGTDPAVADAYRRHLAQNAHDRRFVLIPLAPDAPAYLAQLDAAALHCRTLCWLLTPGVLQSYLDNPGLLERGVRDQTRRRGAVAALLAGGLGPAALPAACAFAAVLEADPVPEVALHRVHVALRARADSIRLDRRIGVPCLVFAPTLDQARQMADPPALMQAIADPAERALRTQQLAAMLAALRRPAGQPPWPDDSYGDQGQDWRPYGPGTPTAREYLEQAARRLNEGEPSKRERLFIKGGAGDSRLLLQLLPYALDEAVPDWRGSRAAVDSVVGGGCVVLVDEMALLHPALRPLAKQLLQGENVAVLCFQPADPPPYSASTMFAHDSSLQVGSLVTRFRDEHDPRCEVAIHSPDRLRRWLRLVLPELVPTLGGEEVQAGLRNRPDEEVFGRPVPA